MKDGMQLRSNPKCCGNCKCRCSSSGLRVEKLVEDVVYYRSMLIEISNLLIANRSREELLKIIELGLRKE